MKVVQNRFALVSMLLVLLSLAGTPRMAIAKLSGEDISWRRVSSDGRYVLVMVSSLPVDDDAFYGIYDEKAYQDIRQVRATYSQSGLYLNDGSTTPLWTIRYISWWSPVHIAPDGEHLIVGGDDYLAVWFFHKGDSLACYSFTDIVSNWRIKSLISGYPRCVSSHFDADSMTYTVHTNQREEFTFDVTTGEVVGVKSPWPFYFSGAIAGVVALSCLVAAIILRQRR